MFSAKYLGEIGLLVKIQALFRQRGGAPRHQSHGLQFNGHIGHHKRHRLAVADGFTERHALVDIGFDVIEYRLAGADGQRADTEAAQVDKTLQVEGAIAEQCLCGQLHIVELQCRQLCAQQPHIGLRRAGQASGSALDNKRSAIAVVQAREDQYQFCIHAQRNHGFGAGQGVAAVCCAGAHCRRAGIEGRAGFQQRGGGCFEFTRAKKRQIFFSLCI